MMPQGVQVQPLQHVLVKVGEDVGREDKRLDRVETEQVYRCDRARDLTRRSRNIQLKQLLGDSESKPDRTLLRGIENRICLLV